MTKDLKKLIPWKKSNFRAVRRAAITHSGSTLVAKHCFSPFRPSHHRPDFAGFSRPFHGVFTVLSWPFHVFFHGITIFANLEGASTIFQASDIFGGGTLLGQVSQKYDIKKKSHRENPQSTAFWTSETCWWWFIKASPLNFSSDVFFWP